MYGFTGKVAIVTGAAHGLGQAIALRLAEEGARLVLADVQPGPAEETAAQARKRGVPAVVVPTDVQDAAQVRRLLDRAVAEFGQVDQLVNSAGVNVNSRLEDITEAQWDRIIDINLKGTFLTCQAIGQHMAGRRQGRIVNIASNAGKTGFNFVIPYSASKGGVVILTQSLARALGPAGVNVNCVCPAHVWTAMTEASNTWFAQHVEQFTGMTARQVYESRGKGNNCLGETPTPADIAAAVAFLLSDQARMITGQSINVCGDMEFH